MEAVKNLVLIIVVKVMLVIGMVIIRIMIES